MIDDNDGVLLPCWLLSLLFLPLWMLRCSLADAFVVVAVGVVVSLTMAVPHCGGGPTCASPTPAEAYIPRWDADAGGRSA